MGTKTGKVFVAGGSGMVGSAIIRGLIQAGHTNIICSYHSRRPKPELLAPEGFDIVSQDSDLMRLLPHRTGPRPRGDHSPRLSNRSLLVSNKLDLTDQSAVNAFFAEQEPEYVVLAAAKVGGILANDTYRADFIYQNLMLEANTIFAAYRHGVKKLLFLGSSCIYPKLAEQPMSEEALLTGPLEPTNEPYALAKIAGIRMCDAFNRQYQTNFISAMPTNLYGPGDNYDLKSSHVLPALIRKFHLGRCLEQGDWDVLRADLNARPIDSVDGDAPDKAILEALEANGISCPPSSSRPTIRLWGSGSPRREFLYVDDLAAACVYLLEEKDYQDLAFTDASGTVQAHVNIGFEQEVSIRELAEMIKEITCFSGRIEWDETKPDGTPRKLMTSKRMRSLGWRPKTGLREGIQLAYQAM